MEALKISKQILVLALLLLIPSEGWGAQHKIQIRTRNLYEKHCASCHGKKGAGGKASSLDANGHAWHHPDGQIFLWIKNGRYGPAIRMPGFGNTFSAKEICSFIGLMKEWWTNEQLEIQKKGSEAFAGQNFCSR